MSHTSLKWALWLAERGFKIGPLPEGKKVGPALWKDIYTTDAKRIRSWFDIKPEMNYLVCPGEGYGIIDLDMGGDKDGIARFEEFVDEYLVAPKTFTVETWSGGRHIYYKVPEEIGNSAGTIAHGIDVRGSGGYVVGPGSQIEGKFYTVTDQNEVADAPEWVVEKMSASRARSDDAATPMFEMDLPDNIQRAEDMLALRDPAIEGEGGDHHTFATFLQIRDFCVSKEKAMELITEVGGWNERCEPPWEISELEIKADNAYQFAKDRPGSKGGVLDLYDDSDQFVALDDMTDVNDMDFTGEVVDALAPVADVSRLKGLALQGSEMWEANTHQEFIIPEWIPNDGYVALLAARGVGKTTLMVDIASCIALDMDWHGWPVLKGYHVVYFCGEHDTVALQLFRAWKDHNGGKDVAENNRFIFVRNSGELTNEATVKHWMKEMRERIGPEGKAVVFIDTWQRATAGKSQNNDEDMGLAIKNVEMISKALDGPAILACHPPKGDPDTVSGWFGIENQSAAILKMDDDDGDKTVEVIRLKGLGEGNKMEMVFDRVDFGETDAHGRDITGQAITWTGGTNPIQGEADAPPSESQEKELNNKRQVLGKFLMALKRHGADLEEKVTGDINMNVVAAVIVRLRKLHRSKCSPIELELREVGGKVLFEGAGEELKFQRMIRKCFIANRDMATVEDDGKEWEVGFETKGRAELLKIRPVI